MRFAAIVLTLLAALGVTTGALAARAAQDPKKLALRESDLPADARRMSERLTRSAQLPNGARGQAYTTTFQFPKGQKREIVTVLLITTENSSQARAVFGALLAQAKRDDENGPVRLPAYGDEQFAMVTGVVRHDEAGATLLARKNSVIWSLAITSDPLAKDYGFSKAQALAELRTYAGKQKRRVGNG